MIGEKSPLHPSSPRASQRRSRQIVSANVCSRHLSDIAILPKCDLKERDLKPYAQPVTAKVLERGKVYFSVQFADDDMLIPIMETWVFAGSNLDPEDAENHLYF